MAICILNGEQFKYEFDLFSAFNSEDAETAAKESGFFNIINLIEKELKDNGLLSSLFVEFNLMGSLLSTDRPDKLNSLVYIRQEEDSGFAEKIKKYSDSIISDFVKNKHFTLSFIQMFLLIHYTLKYVIL